MRYYKCSYTKFIYRRYYGIDGDITIERYYPQKRWHSIGDFFTESDADKTLQNLNVTEITKGDVFIEMI